MKKKVIDIINHFEDIEKQFSTPEIIGNPDRLKTTQFLASLRWGRLQNWSSSTNGASLKQQTL